MDLIFLCSFSFSFRSNKLFQFDLALILITNGDLRNILVLELLVLVLIKGRFGPNVSSQFFRRLAVDEDPCGSSSRPMPLH